jgi:uncharacterized repeat protein (TIGR01451 family)
MPIQVSRACASALLLSVLALQTLYPISYALAEEPAAAGNEQVKEFEPLPQEEVEEVKDIRELPQEEVSDDEGADETNDADESAGSNEEEMTEDAIEEEIEKADDTGADTGNDDSDGSAPAEEETGNESDDDDATSVSDSGSDRSGAKSGTEAAPTDTKEEEGDVGETIVQPEIQAGTGSSPAEVNTDPEIGTENEDDLDDVGGDVPGDEVGAEAGVGQSSSTPTIVSGDSIALANILNIVNTTLVNSSGGFYFSNFFDDVEEAIDFRDYLAFGSGCGPVACAGGQDIRLNVENQAAIDNLIALVATSGGNLIENAGAATIQSGNAYAGLNLINLANTNIIDSQYLVVTVNAFQDVLGDLIFPSLARFFGSALAGGMDTEITNAAEIENSISVTGESGGNTAENVGNAEIRGGSSNAFVNVLNMLNSSLTGGESMSLRFNFLNPWDGEVFGAPEGLSWLRTEDGGLEFSFGGSGNGGPVRGGRYAASSTAAVANGITVHAGTGDNSVVNADSALISSGNAYAAANVVNIANTNIIGRNWMLAVVNIFGDFTGDISFGRPDLWVGEQVRVPGTIANGSELTYTISVINNGDAEATAVTVTDAYDEEHLEVVSSSLAYAEGAGDELVWTVPRLGPGEATEIVYQARVRNASGETAITSEVSSRSRETDDDISDNRDSVTVYTSRSQREKEEEIEEKGEEVESIAGVLKLERQTKSATIRETSEIARQQLTVRNAGDEAIGGVVLHDLLRSPDGMVIGDEPWDIGALQPGEKVLIGYDIHFSDGARHGTYGLSTIVTTEEGERLAFDNGKITLSLLSKIPVIGSVLGAAVGPAPAVVEPAPRVLEREIVSMNFTNSLIDSFGIKQAFAAEPGMSGSMRPTLPYQSLIAASLMAAVLTMLIYAVRRRFDAHGQADEA